MSVAPQEIKDKYEEIIPGVFAGVPNEEYHASEGLSSTNVRDIDKSIADYLWKKEYPMKQTDAMIVGSALHDKVLLPDVYDETYFTAPVKGKKTKAYAKAVEENPDKIVLTSEQGDNVIAMRDSLFANPTIAKILRSDTTLREVSIWAEDPHTGLLLKVRLDLLLDGIIHDLKTTSGGVHPRGFLQSVYKFQYHVQAAYYMYVASLIGINVGGFVFDCVRSVPPHLTAIYDLNEDLLDEGAIIVERALSAYNRYVTGKDSWTGIECGREIVTL